MHFANFESSIILFALLVPICQKMGSLLKQEHYIKKLSTSVWLSTLQFFLCKQQCLKSEVVCLLWNCEFNCSLFNYSGWPMFYAQQEPEPEKHLKILGSLLGVQSNVYRIIKGLLRWPMNHRASLLTDPDWADLPLRSPSTCSYCTTWKSAVQTGLFIVCTSWFVYHILPGYYT